MAIEIWELMTSRRQTIGENPSLERKYFLTGESDDSVVRTFLNATLAATISGLWLDSYSLEPRDDAEYWEASVQYVDKEDKEDSNTSTDPKNRQVRFTGGAVSGKRFNALATPQDSYQNPTIIGPTPDPGVAINVQDDEILGADVILSNGSFSETHTVPVINITNSEIFRLLDAQGTINSDTFRGAVGKTVLFETFDIDWQGGGADEAKVTYNFRYSKREPALMVGNIGPIVKEGWEFLWVTYLTSSADGKPTRTPVNAYVAEVYETSIFANLLIAQ